MEFAKPLKLVERILMALVYWLGPTTYTLLASTYRVRHIGWKGALAFCRNRAPFVGVIWHQRLFCGPRFLGFVPKLAFMVSQSKDGEMIRYVVEGLGYRVIEGSSSRRGSAAYLETIRHLKEGGVVAITPDGPRGPARRVQRGAPRLAVELGLKLLPASISARRCSIIPSWDRFLFPLPFTQVVFTWGRPVSVKKGGGPEEVERVSRLLERELDRLTDEADREAGHAPLPRARGH